MENIKKWLGSIIILPIAIWLINNNGNFIPLIDHFTLLIHEGGHGIFKIFGSFIYTLGGSLMQILMAGLFIFYFYINKKMLGVQFSLIFLSENLFNISKYAADAQARKLPLLGGNKVYHDWHFLLSKMNILQYDQIVGYCFITLAIISLIAALLVPLLPDEEKHINLNLDI
ncbi:MAG: hypothetical protein HYS24_12575 [Ignavibacteriales bacterium]|nr:hypothetical protein [Ignavibacteriales bacterium]MBK7981163.1 hypothetical protein [Ignavibacteriota bacterium]